MKRILLDTNAYVAFRQGQHEVVTILQHADVIGVSVIVLGELIAGFVAGTQYNKNLLELNTFLETPRIRVFAIDETTTTFYATIYATLRQKGKPIPTNDLWIAATALQQGCKLCSFDKHFHAIENLIVASTLEAFLF